ncbi:MAG: hypothetical protein FD187_2896 [bacterium]|nr:MAG: hypothetical protein FD142_2622 [bacterium]KAF0147276.1 MAG: hypothetical protein FD187_2896 [bacterium]KAF0164220.1 MAG: hypothetical protein FD158_3073 [bacterium]TXT16682.1 MAG: hypothetical protein FD132_2736 [bacterium]
MFPLPLTLTVAPSRQLRVGMAVLHLLAGAALWLAALPVPVQVAGTLLLLLSLAARPGQAAATTLRGKADGVLEILQDDTWRAVATLRAPLRTPALTLLRYRLAGDRRDRRLLVLPDSLPAEDARRFRVWLGWLAKDAGRASDADGHET